MFSPGGGYAGLTPLGLTEAIATAAWQDDIAALVEFVQQPTVTVFADRGAIQVIGRDGESIIGHIPVAPQTLARVRAAQ